MSKAVAILGSTGSVGTAALDVCRQHPDRFRVVSLAAGSNIDLVAKQANEFLPELVSVRSETDAQRLKSILPKSIEITHGEAGAVAAATHADAQTVVSAIVGAAGLLPTMRAIQLGKTVGLANKESMVIAGEIMTSAVKQNNAKLLPIDSEHSAIFQCLDGEHHDDIQKIILTASGGPFRDKSANELKSVTREQALKHPNWSMGPKITIDSSSLMNKGLEVIEARHLFDFPIDKISVVVHPQSIVHSMVEFVDGCVVAQLSEPDMRAPVAYALSYPRRVSCGLKKLDLPAREQLTFSAPDFDRFPCLGLAFSAAREGGDRPAVLNAANEVAVQAFLDGKIQFVEIWQLIADVLNSVPTAAFRELSDVIEADRKAREVGQSWLNKRGI